MRTASTLALCGLYIAAVLAGASRLGPVMTPWFLAGLSAAFAWGYISITRGRSLAALSIVAVVTVVLPLMAVIALAWPLHRSLSGLFGSLWIAFQEQGLGSGLQLLAPPLAAGVILFFA